MNKKEEFINFIKTKPEMVKLVQNKEKTWQDLYEIYTLYGTDSKAWDFKSESKTKITDLVKNIDVDRIKEHLDTAQKALDLIGELTTKEIPVKDVIKPLSEINHFFED